MAAQIDEKGHVAIKVRGDEPKSSRPLSEITSTVPLDVYKDYDKQLFHHVVQDATRWAYGVVYVEVWVLDDTSSKLFRPEGGWSIEPSAYDSKFEPLTDSQSAAYLEPHQLVPGEGLPGMIFSVTGGRHHVTSTGVGKDGITLSNSKIQWYAVKTFADDPDQPYNRRLIHLGDCGLMVAGVAFKVGDKEGIVTYFARESSDPKKLEDPLNVEYMKHATMLIGSAYAHRSYRQNIIHTRKRASENGWRSLKKSVLQLHREGKCLAEHLEEKQRMKLKRDERLLPSSGQNFLIHSVRAAASQVCHKIKNVAKKCLGANVKAPLKFNWSESAWTFAGCFITLSIICNINDALGAAYGSDYKIVMGPFGALMTLQYGLTSAPASQPRNILIGQIVGMFLAYGIGESDIAPWLKTTLATSLAISVMVKLGITHPPAGAGALLFSSGNYKIQQVGMNLMANVVAVLTAVIINNTDKHRQYPTFWGLRPISNCIFGEKKLKEAGKEE